MCSIKLYFDLFPGKILKDTETLDGLKMEDGNTLQMVVTKGFYSIIYKTSFKKNIFQAQPASTTNTSSQEQQSTGNQNPSAGLGGFGDLGGLGGFGGMGGMPGMGGMGGLGGMSIKK